MRALLSLRAGAAVLVGFVGLGGATAACSGLIGITDVPTPEDAGAADVGVPDTTPPRDANMPPVDANHPVDAGQDVVTPVDAPVDSPVDTGIDSAPPPFDAGHPPEVVVASPSDNAFYVYDATAGTIIQKVTAGPVGRNVSPYGITYGPDHNLYVAEFSNKDVLEYDGATFAFIKVFVAATPNFAYGCRFGPDGSLYVGVSGGAVYKYDATGAQVGGQFTATTHGDFGGMAFHNGSLFVSYISSPAPLYQYNAATGAEVAMLYNGFSSTNGPRAPAWGPDGNMYVPDWQSANIAKFNGGTLAFVSNIVSDTGNLSPSSVDFRADGTMVVLNDQSTDTVRLYNYTTGAFISTLVPSGSGGLTRATELVVIP